MAEMAIPTIVAGGVPAGDETTQRLLAMWRELLGLDSVGPDDNYFDLGGDSALAVHLFARIEKEFGVKLPLATLFEAQTVSELTEVLRSKAQPVGWSPLVTVQSNGSRAKFFCVHGAGGNVFIYRDLAKLLGPDQPFYGLQSRGLDGKEELQSTVADMARVYVDAVQRVQPHGPYFLGGYCMGGTVAYEMAQQLSAKGEQVGMVALFDTADWSQVAMYSKWARAGYQGQGYGFTCGISCCWARAIKRNFSARSGRCSRAARRFGRARSPGCLRVKGKRNRSRRCSRVFGRTTTVAQRITSRSR
jgi:phthiocerol/phenolphthiocerol synthesis type-I polyketide synthase E